MEETWKVCTIPVYDLLTVKKCILTTEHTCPGMFLPGAWRWHEACGQLTCQEHVDCETPFLVYIEFISQLFHFISLNVYVNVCYLTLIVSLYNKNIGQSVT